MLLLYDAQPFLLPKPMALDRGRTQTAPHSNGLNERYPRGLPFPTEIVRGMRISAGLRVDGRWKSAMEQRARRARQRAVAGARMRAVRRGGSGARLGLRAGKGAFGGSGRLMARISGRASSAGGPRRFMCGGCGSGARYAVLREADARRVCAGCLDRLYPFRAAV